MASQAKAQPRVNRPPLPAGLDADEMLRLFEQMTLLRRFEVAAGIACRKGETPGFLHLYIGEEAVATGVCAHLRRPTGSPPPIAAMAMRWPRAWTRTC